MQVQQCGFLLQAESLLSTRGDDWAMLQDVTEAWAYLGGVHLVLLPEALEGVEATEGVTLRGGRHHPTLCFTPAELGFPSAGAAADLGLEIGAEIAVVPVFATQVRANPNPNPDPNPHPNPNPDPKPDPDPNPDPNPRPDPNLTPCSPRRGSTRSRRSPTCCARTPQSRRGSTPPRSRPSSTTRQS